MCRAGLVNSCAAHYIKGSIFFWYGYLTFARYLGAYADLGWAWNRRPSQNSVSAEMIECAVIFTYGITNTWMERFGAAPGSPYTVKQVQHISIAVMFWFAGLSGMLLESRWVRRVLASVMSTGRSSTKEPATYAFSFNPLPALTIGVVGHLLCDGFDPLTDILIDWSCHGCSSSDICFPGADSLFVGYPSRRWLPLQMFHLHIPLCLPSYSLRLAL